VFADRIVRGAGVCKTLDLAVCRRAGDRRCPVAVPVQSDVGHRRALAHQRGRRLELPAVRQPGADARRHRRGLEAGQLQLPVLSRGPAIDPQVAARGRGDRRRRTGRRFATIVFPLLSPTTFFLLVVNIVYAFFDTFGIIDAATSGGPGQATEILVYKVYKDGFKGLDLGGSAAQSVVLMTIVITLTVIQFRYVERKVQY
jgi:hypothetical protein